MLNSLVSLMGQFEADAALPKDVRQQRDRRVGLELASLQGTPRRQIQRWLERVAAEETLENGHRADHGRRLFAAILLLAGGIGGWGALLAVFAYDGSEPVNVVNVLALFVIGQLLLLLLFLIVLLPPGLVRFMPGFNALQSLLGQLNPGRWLAALTRRFPVLQHRGFEVLLRDRRKSAGALQPVLKWLFSHWSQWFAVGFNLGAIGAALYLVTFTDLAFGWSTTLAVESQGFQRLCQWLAIPWSEWIPQAVPDTELVDISRWYRIDAGNGAKNTTLDPALLGRWWPFLLLSIIVYGLLPRLAALLFSGLRLQAATANALLRYPGSEALLERLNQPRITTQSDEREAPGARPQTGLYWDDDIAFAGKPFLVIDWAGALSSAGASEQLILASRIELQQQFKAGGRQSLEQDAAAIDEIAGRRPPEDVMVVVKAWESPMLDCADFLRELKMRLDRSKRIVVIAATFTDDGELTATGGEDLETWRQSLAAMADSRFTVTALT